MERKRLVRERHRIMKQRKQLEAFAKPSLQAAATTEYNIDNSNEEITTEGIEEFQDAVYSKKVIDDYMEDYEDDSGEMTDEDYL